MIASDSTADCAKELTSISSGAHAVLHRRSDRSAISHVAQFTAASNWRGCSRRTAGLDGGRERSRLERRAAGSKTKRIIRKQQKRPRDDLTF